MSHQLIAQITGTVEASYQNEPAPSEYINLSLQKRGDFGDWVQVMWQEVSIDNPSVPMAFEVSDPGQYRVVCRRASVSGDLMGPSAESPEVFIGSGTYAAPFSVTLTLAPAVPGSLAVGNDDKPF